MENYTDAKLIFRSLHSFVYVARSIKTKQHIILKFSPLDLYSNLNLNTVRELTALNNLKSPFVVKLLDHFRHKNFYCLVLPFYRSDLVQYQPTDEFTFKKLIWQLLTAVQHSHRKGFIHRDIKSANIFVGQQNLVLADFDSSTFYNNIDFCEEVTSLYWRAPECLLFQSYDRKIDLWSVGCVAVEMLTKKPLFMGRNRFEVLIEIVKFLNCSQYLEKILNAKVFAYLKQFQQQSAKQNLKQLLQNCLILSDKDLFIDFVLLLLEQDPTKRATTEQSLKHPYLAEICRFYEKNYLF